MVAASGVNKNDIVAEVAVATRCDGVYAVQLRNFECPMHRGLPWVPGLGDLEVMLPAVSIM